MKKYLIKYKLVIFIIVVASLTFLGNSLIDFYNENKRELPVYGKSTKLENGKENFHQIPAFEFINQRSNNFSEKDVKGKIWVANYFFTSCPTICPQMSYNLQTVHDLYRNDDEIMICSYTVDPKRDNPSRLKKYADKYNADHSKWQFLTGAKPELYWLARNGFYISATEGAGDELDFIHSENLVLIDHEMRIRGYYNGTDKKAVNQLIKDIAKLKKNRS